MKPSARAPTAFCEPRELLRRCVSLAVLDAILSPDWQYRYYSFDAAWGEDALMGSMRDGSGDDLFIAFGTGGVFLKGFVHDAPMAPRAWNRDGTVWPGMYGGLPASLEGFRDEPAFSRDSVTFCLWWDAERPGWAVGVREFPEGHDPDGSEELLAIYDGRPETYASWASDYYETDVPLDAVASIYRQEPLTVDLVQRLNPEAHLDAVLEESASWPYGEAERA
jgi:hypothetical protein